MLYSKAIMLQYVVTVGWAVAAAVSMGIGLAVAIRVFMLLTPKIGEMEGLRKGNIAVAVVLPAMVLAMALTCPCCEKRPTHPATRPGDLGPYMTLAVAGLRPVRVVTTLRDVEHAYASSPAGFFGMKDGKAVFTGYVRQMQDDRVLLVASAPLLSTPIPDIPADSKVTIPRDAIVSSERVPPATQAGQEAG